MEKRYQIFISSTYEDLKRERELVTNQVFEQGHIPIGMEAFPAAARSQWEFIRRLIIQSDYYIVILGGRYGSIGDDGLSYTHKEFQLARELNKPILVFFRRDLDKLPEDNRDDDLTSIKAFHVEACRDILARGWSNETYLLIGLPASLNNAILEFPAVGWVRANTLSSTDAISELNDLRKEKEELINKLSLTSNSAINKDLDVSIEEILNGFVELTGTSKLSLAKDAPWKARTSIMDIWLSLAQGMDASKTQEAVRHILEKAFMPTQAIINRMDEEAIAQTKAVLASIGLVSITYGNSTAKTYHTWWTATDLGRGVVTKHHMGRFLAENDLKSD